LSKDGDDPKETENHAFLDVDDGTTPPISKQQQMQMQMLMLMQCSKP
jgi:hypothetical protein